MLELRAPLSNFIEEVLYKSTNEYTMNILILDMLNNHNFNNNLNQIIFSGMYPYVTQGLKAAMCRFFGFFYSVIIYTASASKCFSQNENIFFLTEVILV